MKRRIVVLSIAMIFIFVLSLFPRELFAVEKPGNNFQEKFGDVQNHTAKNQIKKWQENRVIMGYQGNFRPDDLITRAEFSALLNRVIASSKTGEGTFPDMDEKAWYYRDMMSLYHSGILAEKSGKLNPQGYVGYEEAEEIFSRVFDTRKKWNPSRKDGFLTRAQAILLLDEKIAGFYFKQGNYKGKIRGNVVVNTSNVKLTNMKIDGNLYIMDGVGDGDVHLENVKVSGKILVKGGGPRSVHIDNCEINELVSMKDEVRIVFTNGTTVSFLRSQVDDGILEFKDAKISNMTILGDGLQVKLENSAISNLNVEANKIDIKADVNSSMEVVHLNGQANITGKGKITEAIVNKNGSVIENKPKKVVANNGVNIEIANGTSNSQSEDTGSSSADDYEPYNPPTPPVEPPTPPVTPPNPPVEEEIFAFHSVANKDNIPYNTEFEALDMPTEATLTSTKANIVKVNLQWAKEDYDKKKTGEQILKVSVSAKTGELPNWAPGEIQVKVNVKMPPLPKKMRISKRYLANEIEKDTVFKGEKSNYMLQVFDENNSILNSERLKELDVSLSIDPIENIKTMLVMDEISLFQVSVPENYEASEFILKVRCSYTFGAGGEFFNTIEIKVEEAPQLPPPPQKFRTDTEEGEVSDKGCFNFWITEPEDISNIARYEAGIVEADSDVEYPINIFFLPNYPGDEIYGFAKPSIPDAAFHSGKKYYLQVRTVDRLGRKSEMVKDENFAFVFVEDAEFDTMKWSDMKWSASPHEQGVLYLKEGMKYQYDGDVVYPEEYLEIRVVYDSKSSAEEEIYFENGELYSDQRFALYPDDNVSFASARKFYISMRRLHPITKMSGEEKTYKYKYSRGFGFELEKIEME